jgi:TonB family protein
MRRGIRNTAALILLTPLLTFAQTPEGSLDAPTVFSDTAGYNFSKYLSALVQRVRTNWYSVMPEAARKGEKGRVVVTFTIARNNGQVQDLRVTDKSGVRPLEHAAVLAIQMSNPFEALPGDFKGDRLTLGIPFLYNLQPR